MGDESVFSLLHPHACGGGGRKDILVLARTGSDRHWPIFIYVLYESFTGISQRKKRRTEKKNKMAEFEIATEKFATLQGNVVVITGNSSCSGSAVRQLVRTATN